VLKPNISPLRNCFYLASCKKTYKGR